MTKGKNQNNLDLTARVFTFPFWIWTDRVVTTSVVELKLSGGKLLSYGPFRMAEANYTPLPEVNPERIPFKAGLKPNTKLLQNSKYAVYPRIDGNSALVQPTPIFEQDLDPLPTDAYRLDIMKYPSGFDYESFIFNLLEWIRCSTNQWWVGKQMGPLIGYEKSSFKINNVGEPTENAFSKQNFTTTKPNTVSLSLDVFKGILLKAASCQKPKIFKSLILDAQYFFHTNDLRRAILEATIACEETLIDKSSEIWNKRDSINDFKTGKFFKFESLDKRLDKDLDRVLNRSLKKEQSTTFENIKRLWILRHQTAHTGKLNLDMGSNSVNQIDEKEDVKILIDSAERTIEWITDLD